jgi:hypothetical protein
VNTSGKTWITIGLLTLLLAACAPSEGAIQTAIGQTQAANPTATPPPTQAPTGTATATALPTATATTAAATTGKATPAGATATQQPKSDGRVIDVNPVELILTKQDMPADGLYFLPIGGAYGPITNAEVVAGMTPDRRKAYLSSSGRIYGYETELQRGSYKYAGPPDVRNQVVIYESGADASAAVAADADCTRFEGFDPSTKGFSIGDTSVVCVQDANGMIAYWLAFAFRNQVVVIEGAGTKAETELAFFQALAERQLAILQEQPLSDSVTFTP